MRTTGSGLWDDLLRKALDRSSIKEMIEKGGHGSGNAGHSGRPGEVGGSALGGDMLGRADAPDSDTHFKFSGSTTLRRAKGPHINLSMRSEKGRGSLEIHGEAKDGKTVPNRAVLNVGGKTVSIDHEELHSIRTKMRWMQTCNEKNSNDLIAGKVPSRGNSIEVQIGAGMVVIPVNKRTVEMMDWAVKSSRDKGYSLTAERRSVVASAVRAMHQNNPIAEAKSRGFSKAGTLASHMAHLERPSLESFGRGVSIRGAGRPPSTKQFFRNVYKQLVEVRAKAREALKNLSGTQAASLYKRGAVLATILKRRK